MGKWTLPVLCLVGMGLLLLPEFFAEKESLPLPSGPPQIDWRIAAMDQNSDGKVTLEEAQTVRPEMTAEDYKLRDYNGDGIWTMDDRRPGYRTMAGRQRLEEIDTNSDGKVSLDEYTTACEREFKILDSDADGGISSDEWPRRGPGMVGARPWGPSSDDPNRMQLMGPPFGGFREGGPPPFGPDGVEPPGPPPGEPMGVEGQVEGASDTSTAGTVPSGQN